MRQTFIALFALLLLVLASCIEILNFSQPSTAEINEEITTTFDVKITNEFGSIMVFAFLAPLSWKAGENTTVTYQSDQGNSTFSLMPEDEVDVENQLPWKQQITDRVGIGNNYGEVGWVVFKADVVNPIPAGTKDSNPIVATVTVKTKVGTSNVITSLGYFVGEAEFGYLNDDSNKDVWFAEACIEITGASGQPQNLCGEAPRQLISLPTYTFRDLLNIRFDANEEQTALMGTNSVHLCASAVLEDGTTVRCNRDANTQMKMVSPDVWEIVIWPPSYFGLADDAAILEILINFQDDSGATVVRNPDENDFQILEKCF